MAAEMCLIGVMDRLWFHQIILFSEPSLFHLPHQSPKKPQPQTESLSVVNYHSSKNSSQMSVISESEQQSSHDETTTRSSSNTSSQESDIDKETTQHDDENRPTRQNLVSNKTRSHSSSPLSSQKKQSRSNLSHSGYTYSGGRLQKTLSCKTLIELELEEVKGFMDLGFVFSKQNLSKPMMSLIPGLQRLENEEHGEKDSLEFACSNDDGFEEDGEKVVMRPYLSEAWHVKRREYSPLMNLRVPMRVSTSENMKKHLKNWARTVASAIQQE